MSIIKVSKEENIGNTMTGAAMTAFGKKNQRDVKVRLFHGLTMVSVWIGGKWVDYDAWVRDGEFCFLLAE